MLLICHNKLPFVLPYDKNRTRLSFSAGTYPAKEGISKKAGDGNVIERDEGCGGTFAPGRLHSSHEEASVRDIPHSL